MSADVLVHRAGRWLEDIEAWETRRTGDLGRARDLVAGAIRVSPGTLERIRRRRVKDVRGSVLTAIGKRFAKSVRQEIARLENELALALALGLDVDSDAAREGEAALVDAKTTFGP